MSDLVLLGRILLGGFFTYVGLNHLINPAAMAEYAASKGVPLPEVAARRYLAASFRTLAGTGITTYTLPVSVSTVVRSRIVTPLRFSASVPA